MDNYIDYIKENGFTESEWESLTPIEKARYVRKTNEKYGIKTSPIDKFISNPTIRKAVSMFCFECSGYNRHDANTCNQSNCALWLFRKGNAKIKENEFSKWKNSYSKWINNNIDD